MAQGAQETVSSPPSQKSHIRETPSEEMMVSLGDALAGVTMTPKTGSFGFDGTGSDPGVSSSNFMSSGASGGKGSWGFPSFSNGGFPGTNSVPTSNGEQQQQQPSSDNMPGSSLLTGSTTSTTGGSYSDPEQADSERNLMFKMQSEPTTPVRKKSLELFLSQSPSKTLGGDLLQLNVAGGKGGLNDGQTTTIHRTGSAFSLEEMGRTHLNSQFTNGNIASSTGDLRHDPTIRRGKAESPSSVTGTSASSRSASPYTNVTVESDSRRTIQAFTNTEVPGSSSRPFAQQQQATAEVNRLNSTQRSFGGTPEQHEEELRGNNNMRTLDYGYGQGMESIPPAATQPPPAAAAAPQVLYMAVPTPDGRGQMLQAVQMVQMPGQPSTYVFPTATTTGGLAAQPMMVLPQQGVVTNDLSGLGAATPATNWSSTPTTTPYSQNPRDNDYGRFGGARGSPEDFRRSPQEQSRARQQQQLPIIPPGDSIASLYAAPQRPPLDELLGNVRRLSRDQVGCRLLQQALDEEGPMAATLVLNEGLSFWGEAMVDPFGNYLFQKILEKITPEERVMLVKSVSARLVNASLNLHGTRSVQKVVEMCALDEASGAISKDHPDGTAAEILTTALTPAAARLCIDSHGNHVIQRILLKLGYQHATFVFDAVAASVGDVARHRHGCCVIQRCLDSPPSDARSHLVHRIVENCLDLMQDAYGNYVVQYVLDVCEDADVHAVCECTVGRVCLLAIQKFSSNVMEKCLERCTERVKEHYMTELSDPERIRELMMDPFGNYVVQRALSVATHAQAVRLVEAMRPHLISSGTPYGQRSAGAMRNTAGGRRIMAKICRRFPNFTLSESATPEELYSQNKQARARAQQQQQLPQLGGGLGYGGDTRGGGRRHHHEQQQHQAYFETAAPPPGYYEAQFHGYPQM